MRNIPDKYKDLPAAQVLAAAQTEFLKASQALVEANHAAQAAGRRLSAEMEERAKSLGDAEQRMKAAETAFDLATGGPQAKPLSDLVRKKVQQSFPAEKHSRVIELLETECADNLPFTDGTPQSLERVRLAVVKVSAGNENKLCEQLEMAKRDWRDVINAAEYPEATKLGLVEYSKLDERNRQKIDHRDREQYLTWLGVADTSKSRQSRFWPWSRKK